MKTPGAVLAALAALALAPNAAAQSSARFKAHDMSRPRPPVVQPAAEALPVPPPSDAIVLFDGTDLSEWRSADGGPAKWVVEDGAIESVPGSGYLYSARGFGDVQLHVEWAAPVPARGRSQGRGNSGVFLMGLYEVQVLDSYQNDTYPDGQAAAVYGQYPPLVNACRPPGEWQTYDIVFRRPRFRPDGGLAAPARITVIHNGVLVQDGVEPWGPTAWLQALPYTAHADKLPLAFQDHGNPVRYRNIWLRELPEGPTGAAHARPAAGGQPASRPARSVRGPVRGRGRAERGLHDHASGPPALSSRAGTVGPWSWCPTRTGPSRCAGPPGRWTSTWSPTARSSGLTFRLGGDTRTATRVE